MPTCETRLLTISEIASRLGRPRHKVQYVIRSRSIEPVGVAGLTNVFKEGDVEFIARELRRIDEEKCGGI